MITIYETYDEVKLVQRQETSYLFEGQERLF